MSGVTELKTRMGQLFTELKPLHEKGSERSADEEARVDAILGEINDLGPKIEREHNIANVSARGSEYTEPNRSAARQVPANEEGRAQETAGQRPDRRSIGRRFTQSQEFRDYQARPQGRGTSFAPGPLFGHRYGFDYDAGDEPLSQRALVNSGVPSASMLLPQVMPTIFRPAEAPLVFRDVVLNGRTSSDTVTILQESGFTNNAAEVAEASAVDGVGLTGGVKPESGIAFTEVSYPVRTIAHWMPVTRQTLSDLPAMETYINNRLLTGLERREDAQLLNGNGTAPNLRGLLQTSGIQNLDGSYFTSNPVVDPGQSNENVNRILRAKVKVMTTGKAMATFVVMNPNDIEKLLTYTDANRNYLFGGPSVAGMNVPIWGLNPVWSENIAEGTALVGDGSMAAVMDREDSQIYVTDSHADFFVRNIFVILGEERLAFPIFRPVAFAAVELV